jgi:ribonucleoside-diphosphate reductase alpha chain
VNYKPEGLAETIFKERYTIHPDETWEEASRRLAKHVSSAEENGSKPIAEEKFYEEIVTNRFMPGGRIWYGSGRPRAQLLNCFVVPTSDSREGWGTTIHDVIVISGMGGGVGINCSPIRPRGSRISGTGGIATGAVSLMHMINAVGDVLVGGGGRRLALMLDLNITHPDMPEFLDAKLDRAELTNANVSIIVDKKLPSETLVKKVRKGENFDLMWGGSSVKKVNAKEIWEKIVTNAWTSGEPGILNGDLANKESNIWYYKPLISTNPCGEIWLEEYGSCDLGAIVLPRFVTDSGTCDWDGLRSTITTAVRFLDNVLSINEYPLNAIRDNNQHVRRLGLGIMGLHSMLIKMGRKYSQSNDFIDDLMMFIKEAAYNASIDLAIEKGAFGAYDERFLDSGFSRRSLSTSIRSRIRKNGIRNAAILTIAPTGTTGMVSNVSTGIEPLFAPAYWRRFYRPTSDGSRQLDKELVIDPLWDTVDDPSVLEGAYDITPEAHFDVQRICQRHIDNAVSKTINLPENYPVESLSDLWLEYLPDLKGTTFYRAGSRGEEPLQAIPLGEAKTLYREHQHHSAATIEEQSSMDCPDGSCDVRTIPMDISVEERKLVFV